MPASIYIICGLVIHAAASFDLDQTAVQANRKSLPSSQDVSDSSTSESSSSSEYSDSDGYFRLDEVPNRRFDMNPNWNSMNQCNQSVLLENVLDTVLDLIEDTHTKPIKQDLMQRIFQAVNAYSEAVPNNLQNAKVFRKLKHLTNERGEEVVFPTKETLRNSSNSRTRILFKSKLPKLDEKPCKESFLKLINEAYKSYLDKAMHDTCNASDDEVKPECTSENNVPQNFEVYKLLLNEIRPYIIANPTTEFLWQVLQSYQPGQNLQIPEDFQYPGELNDLFQNIAYLQNGQSLPYYGYSQYPVEKIGAWWKPTAFGIPNQFQNQFYNRWPGSVREGKTHQNALPSDSSLEPNSGQTHKIYTKSFPDRKIPDYIRILKTPLKNANSGLNSLEDLPLTLPKPKTKIIYTSTKIKEPKVIYAYPFPKSSDDGVQENSNHSNNSVKQPDTVEVIKLHKRPKNNNILSSIEIPHSLDIDEQSINNHLDDLQKQPQKESSGDDSISVEVVKQIINNHLIKKPKKDSSEENVIIDSNTKSKIIHSSTQVEHPDTIPYELLSSSDEIKRIFHLKGLPKNIHLNKLEQRLPVSYPKNKISHFSSETENYVDFDEQSINNNLDKLAKHPRKDSNEAVELVSLPKSKIIHSTTKIEYPDVVSVEQRDSSIEIPHLLDVDEQSINNHLNEIVQQSLEDSRQEEVKDYSFKNKHSKSVSSENLVSSIEIPHSLDVDGQSINKHLYKLVQPSEKQSSEDFIVNNHPKTKIKHYSINIPHLVDVDKYTTNNHLGKTVKRPQKGSSEVVNLHSSYKIKYPGSVSSEHPSPSIEIPHYQDADEETVNNHLEGLAKQPHEDSSEYFEVNSHPGDKIKHNSIKIQHPDLIKSQLKPSSDIKIQKYLITEKTPIKVMVLAETREKDTNTPETESSLTDNFLTTSTQSARYTTNEGETTINDVNQPGHTTYYPKTLSTYATTRTISKTTTDNLSPLHADQLFINTDTTISTTDTSEETLKPNSATTSLPEDSDEILHKSVFVQQEPSEELKHFIGQKLQGIQIQSEPSTNQEIEHRFQYQNSGEQSDERSNPLHYEVVEEDHPSKISDHSINNNEYESDQNGIKPEYPSEDKEQPSEYQIATERSNEQSELVNSGDFEKGNPSNPSVYSINTYETQSDQVNDTKPEYLTEYKEQPINSVEKTYSNPGYSLTLEQSAEDQPQSLVSKNNFHANIPPLEEHKPNGILGKHKQVPDNEKPNLVEHISETIEHPDLDHSREDNPTNPESNISSKLNQPSIKVPNPLSETTQFNFKSSSAENDSVTPQHFSEYAMTEKYTFTTDQPLDDLSDTRSKLLNGTSHVNPNKEKLTANSGENDQPRNLIKQKTETPADVYDFSPEFGQKNPSETYYNQYHISHFQPSITESELVETKVNKLSKYVPQSYYVDKPNKVLETVIHKYDVKLHPSDLPVQSHETWYPMHTPEDVKTKQPTQEQQFYEETLNNQTDISPPKVEQTNDSSDQQVKPYLSKSPTSKLSYTEYITIPPTHLNVGPQKSSYSLTKKWLHRKPKIKVTTNVMSQRPKHIYHVLTKEYKPRYPKINQVSVHKLPILQDRGYEVPLSNIKYKLWKDTDKDWTSHEDDNNLNYGPDYTDDILQEWQVNDLVSYPSRYSSQEYTNGILNPNHEKIKIIAYPESLNADDKLPQSIELTYVVKRPQPILYQPYYYVKYTIPYPSFVANVKSLLRVNPSLRSQPDKLFHGLIKVSNITALSPGLKYLPKNNINELISQDGSIVKAKVALGGLPLHQSPDKEVEQLATELSQLASEQNPDHDLIVQKVRDWNNTPRPLVADDYADFGKSYITTETYGIETTISLSTESNQKK